MLQSGNQILWLCFVSRYKDECASLIVLFLQLWIYISLFRSRTRIRLLMEDLFQNIEHAACLHHPEKENIKDLHLGVLLIRGVRDCIPCSDGFQHWDDS
ncbi:hypothetical protein CEXT_12831 [Caerostris extrusa]|uniref:Uncharacterized protein n=1 Tax=Caerostris extrusa TaxID=172846 RepID=A0AAV4SD13_CAEEX|nr:hypothetical protein CEXT_12831 [Caerostris extrusa]